MGIAYAPTTAIVRTDAERLTLIRRTYLVVFAGLLVTMAAVAVAFTQPQIMGAVAQHPWIMLLITFAPLFGAQRTARTFPANVGFTFLFTFLIGLMLAPFLAIAERAQPGILSNAALLTGTTFAALTGYAFVSRRNFNAWGGFFFTGLVVLIVTSLLNAFVFRSTGVSMWLAGATVLVFSGLLVFDTWRLRNSYGPDDYIPAAINIYLDFINLFTAILRLLMGGQRRS
jgi:FtsH-binding integral membrane protein